MNFQKTTRLAGLITLGVVLGLCLSYYTAQPSPEVEMKLSANYIEVTREQMIDQADLIALGEVTEISYTEWNQDSGLIWSTEKRGSEFTVALPLHYVEFTIDRALVDRIGVDSRVTLTVLGNSPLQDPDADHDLVIGDRAVFFARQTQLAWREGGKRPIWQLVGAPIQAYGLEGEDRQYHFARAGEPPLSLDALTAQVEVRRVAE